MSQDLWFLSLKLNVILKITVHYTNYSLGFGTEIYSTLSGFVVDSKLDSDNMYILGCGNFPEAL